MDIIQSKHYQLHELLPSVIFAHLSQNGSLWKGWLLFPRETIITIDSLCDQFGKMYINTYGLSAEIQKKHGKWDGRGYRILDLDKFPNYVSLHCSGQATDGTFDNISAIEARKFILANPGKFPFITCLECTKGGQEINWLHWDRRPISNRIYELHI